MTHICVGKLTIIGSDNGLSPWRRQAIIWTNAGLLLIRQLGTNFSEILIGIQIFSFKKMHLKMSSAKWRPFCLGLNVLKSTKTQQRANRVPICCNALYSTECRRNAGTSIAMYACGYYAKKTGTIFDLLQCICTAIKLLNLNCNIKTFRSNFCKTFSLVYEMAKHVVLAYLAVSEWPCVWIN